MPAGEDRLRRLRAVLGGLGFVALAGLVCAQDESPLRPGMTGIWISLERSQTLLVRLDEAEVVTILADSHDVDVALALEALDGRVLAEDADGGIESNARLVFRTEATGEFRLRIRAASAPATQVRLSFLRGTPAGALADEPQAARAYWQRAWSRAVERDDGERAELALERLVALEPGATRETLEARLFATQDGRHQALEYLQAGEAALAAHDLTRARARLQELTRTLAVLAPQRADALLLDVLLRGFALAHGVQDIPALLGLSERALIHVRATREECDPETVLALYRRGLALRRAAQAAAGLPLLEEAYARWSATLVPEDANVRLARVEYAMALAQSGRAPQAKPLLEQNHAECLRLLAPDDEAVFDARLRLATVSASLGEAETALALGEGLLDWAGGLPPEDSRSFDLRLTLAGALKTLGRYAEARRHMEQAVASIERGAGPDDPRLLMARMNLASLRHLAGDPAAAREAMEPAVASLERTLGEREVALQIARSNLAAMRREAGDLEDARQLQERGLAALAGLDDFSLTARLHGERCLTLAAAGETEALAKALAELARILSVQLARTAHLGLGEAASARAALSSELGTLLSYVPDGSPALLRQAFEWVEGARALGLGGAARRGVIREESELAARMTRVAEARTRAAQAAAEARALGGRPGGLDRLLAAARERDVAERALNEGLEQSGAPVVRFGAPALAARLPPGSAAVSFVRFPGVVPGETRGTIVRRDEFAAFVLLPDGGLRRVRLGTAPALEEEIRAWRNALGRPLEESPSATGPLLAGPARSIGGTRAIAGDELAAAGERLRARLLDPVLAALPEGVHALAIVLDDVLNLVPLDALPLRGGLVGDYLRLAFQPCLGRLLLDDAPPPEAGRALLVGDIAYGPAEGATPALPTLPGAVAELETIAAQLGTIAGLRIETLTGSRATKAAFMIAAHDASFVHVATHGYADPNAESEIAGLLPLSFSGLAFAGATVATGGAGASETRLTAEELAGLDLRRAELVVLSACDTRAGLRRAGQALQSLDTALALAGARASVTSLWSVDDAAARTMMAEFYRRTVALHEDLATALWRAKGALRAQDAPLADWAGWVLSGR